MPRSISLACEALRQRLKVIEPIRSMELGSLLRGDGTLRPDVREWCDKFLTTGLYVEGRRASFRSETDAVLFKLPWTDRVGEAP